MDALRRLEVWGLIFLHGYGSQIEQFEHTGERLRKEEEDIQSASREGGVGGGDDKKEFYIPAHFIVNDFLKRFKRVGMF